MMLLLHWLGCLLFLILYGSTLAYYLAKAITLGILRGKNSFLKLERQNGEN